MNVGIRADSSIQTGSGHYMRCMTLAQKLLGHGVQVYWLAFELLEDHAEKIQELGIDLIRLNSDKVHDFEKASKLLGAKFNWLIVDHYKWAYEEEKVMQSVAERIMVIDDLANRPHHCDLLLDQNEFIGDKNLRYSGLVDEKTKLMLGAQYAILREEFCNRVRMDERPPKSFKVLVSYGGTDPTNETLKAIRALTLIEDEIPFHADIVIGRYHTYRSTIEELCKEHPNFELHVQANTMAELMGKSDIALCAGGTTTWERYCMGLPGVVTTVADNQIEIARFGAGIGVDQYLGMSEYVTVEMLRDKLEEIIKEPKKLEQSRNVAARIVDGLGVQRVINALLS